MVVRRLFSNEEDMHIIRVPSRGGGWLKVALYVADSISFGFGQALSKGLICFDHGRWGY